MDPNAMKFGSGSPLLGGTSALNEAAARRGVDVSAMAQVGGAAPTAQPMPMAPQMGGMGGAPMPAMSTPPMGQPPIPGQPLPQGSDEASIILQALSNRLKSDSKIKEAQAIPPEPKLPVM